MDKIWIKDMDGTIAKVPLFFQFFYSFVPKKFKYLFGQKFPKAAIVKCAVRFKHFWNEVLFDYFKGSVRIRYNKSMPMFLKILRKQILTFAQDIICIFTRPFKSFAIHHSYQSFRIFTLLKPKQVGYFF